MPSGPVVLMPGRTREDTVRQIVAGLTGDSDGTGDLAVELSKTDPASLETGQDSEDDSGDPEDWVPDPVDADPGQHLLPHQALGCGAGPAWWARWSCLLLCVPWGLRGQQSSPAQPGSPGVSTGWVGPSGHIPVQAARGADSQAACAPPPSGMQIWALRHGSVGLA